MVKKDPASCEEGNSPGGDKNREFDHQNSMISLPVIKVYPMLLRVAR
jgi:hypothetical protein